MENNFSEKEQGEGVREPSEEVRKEMPKEEVYPEKQEKLESKDPDKEGKIREKLEEIEKMEVPPELKEEVKKEAIKISELDREGKITRLLILAQEKGLFFAVGVAKGTDDAYLVDAFHDVLAKEELYKKFEK